MNHTFGVDLRGIIDILSNHLYSNPQVFLRELLQNGADAIRAREALGAAPPARIDIERVGGAPPTLVVTDNGIGLGEEEIHEFLATIGRSSKRGGAETPAGAFIGQFGIGLLSCFVVAEEIVLITRSARAGSRTLEWRGRADGTYSVRPLEGSGPVGTQVYLRCAPGMEAHFTPEAVARGTERYGALLPIPVWVSAGGTARWINEEGAPWRRPFASDDERDGELREYGRRVLGEEPFDWIPLRVEAADIDGVAFVLPWAPGRAAHAPHTVYLRGMLLSDTVENLVPEWAFFVRCVVHANGLKPTASRESLHEDGALARAREEIGAELRRYLVGLSRARPERLQQLIALHKHSIQALCLRDEEFCRLFIDWLPFETSMGRMTLGEYRTRFQTVRYVPDLDQFRQVAQVLAAEGECVINAAYNHDAQLLEAFGHLYPAAHVERLDASRVAERFTPLDPGERESAADFARRAGAALAEFGCAVVLRRFSPEELPALLVSRGDALLLRDVGQTREIADPLWGAVLEEVFTPDGEAGPAAHLYLNAGNPLVRRLWTLPQGPVPARMIRMLYVHSLLLGHHPLGSREMEIMNGGLLDLIRWSLDQGRSAP